MVQADAEATVRFLGAHVDSLNHLTRLHLFAQTAGRMTPAARVQLARERLDALNGRLTEHHRDEEQVLLPAMLSGARSAEAQATVKSLTARLVSEHSSIEFLWGQINGQLQAIASGQPVMLAEKQCEELAAMYLFHTEFEETVVLPLAAKLLTHDDKEAMDLNLTLRHQVDDLPAYI